MPFVAPGLEVSNRGQRILFGHVDSGWCLVCRPAASQEADKEKGGPDQGHRGVQDFPGTRPNSLVENPKELPNEAFVSTQISLSTSGAGRQIDTSLCVLVEGNPDLDVVDGPEDQALAFGLQVPEILVGNRRGPTPEAP